MMGNSCARPSPSVLRSILCWLLIAIMPAAAVAADTGAAMLYSKGTAWLNGNTVPNSSAIFPGDMVQTHTASFANINAEGSSVMVMPESLVRFQNNSVCLEHGMVTVGSSRQMAALAGGISITPASTVWTQFDVKDVDGTVQIVAHKGELAVSGAKKVTVQQGQQLNLEERESDDGCGKRKGAAAPPSGSGGLLSSKTALIAGGAAGGGILIWVLMKGDDPMSPDQRKCMATKC